MLVRNLPNMITLVRLLGTIALFFIHPLTVEFYIVYSVCGVSDVLDGCIARMMHTESQIGARLDSVADILFYAVMLLRIFPILWRILPWGIWIFVIVILAVRLFSYILAAVKYHKFASLHTYMNKMTGFSIFLVPYLLKTPISVGFCFFVCVVAMFASTEEFALHLLSKEYTTDAKTIFSFSKKESVTVQKDKA